MTSKAVYSESCACIPHEVFPDGQHHQYYCDEYDAQCAWEKAMLNTNPGLGASQILYSSIHFNNKHVLTFHIPGVCRHCVQNARL